MTNQLSAQLNTPSRQINPSEAITLPNTAEETTAQVLALLRNGDELYEARSAIEALTVHNRALLDAGDEAIAESLARQTAVLETVWLKYIVLSEQARSPEHKATYTKLALNCQRQLVATLGALRQVQQNNGMLAIQ